jgi:hypothetical protein
MPTVAISVDCEAASVGKCYARELVRVAEEFTVPLTWLVFVSVKDPLSNIDLYRNEFFHRIPAWHETGLLLAFENSQGYIADPKERGDAIRVGKDVLKSRHVKPTAFRAARYDLLPGDLKHLEDIGILVDGSACPGAMDKHKVMRPEGPTQPYHPSYEDLNRPGSAKILVVPLATYKGACGCLDNGWDPVQKVLEHSLSTGEFTHLALSDYVDATETLRRTLAYCKEKGARFITLTQAATM